MEDEHPQFGRVPEMERRSEREIRFPFSLSLPYIPIKQTTPSPARHAPAFARHVALSYHPSRCDRPSARPGRPLPCQSLLPSLSHARPSPSARDSRSKARAPDAALTCPYRGPFHPELAEDRPRCVPIGHAPRAFRASVLVPRRVTISASALPRAARPPCAAPRDLRCRARTGSRGLATRGAAEGRVARVLAKDRHHKSNHAILGSGSHTQLRSAFGNFLSSFALCQFASVLRAASREIWSLSRPRCARPPRPSSSAGIEQRPAAGSADPGARPCAHRPGARGVLECTVTHHDAAASVSVGIHSHTYHIRADTPHSNPRRTMASRLMLFHAARPVSDLGPKSLVILRTGLPAQTACAASRQHARPTPLPYRERAY